MTESIRQPFSVSIVGSGMIARGLTLAIQRRNDIHLKSVLTRRDPDSCLEFPRRDLLTRSLDHVLDQTDVLIECSGDVPHATEVINSALQRGVPVVTMNTEFHVTTGSYFAGRGYLTEAEGDQPGSLAALDRESRDMGFQPLVYGNLKGFLDHNPSRASMELWSKRQGISLNQVTSFTDGTKLQMEQALVANGLDATILQQGLAGLSANTVEEGSVHLANLAQGVDRPISDYLLADDHRLPPGIFIAASHEEEQRQMLEYFKLGSNGIYVLVRNYHLCHLEAIRTVLAARYGAPPLLTNSASPSISVAAIAKRPLAKGEVIERGIGSFDVRGEAVRIRDLPNHVPIGLFYQARLRHQVGPGDLLTFDDVELPESLAVRAYQSLHPRTSIAHEDPTSPE